MTREIKVWLDDERPAPDGWIRTYWPDEMIAILQNGGVSSISLDHDLGDDSRGTGYDVLTWIEENVFLHDFEPPTILIHTQNPAARTKMVAAVNSIFRLYAE